MARTAEERVENLGSNWGETKNQSREEEETDNQKGSEAAGRSNGAKLSFRHP